MSNWRSSNNYRSQSRGRGFGSGPGFNRSFQTNRFQHNNTRQDPEFHQYQQEQFEQYREKRRSEDFEKSLETFDKALKRRSKRKKKRRHSKASSGSSSDSESSSSSSSSPERKKKKKSSRSSKTRKRSKIRKRSKKSHSSSSNSDSQEDNPKQKRLAKKHSSDLTTLQMTNQVLVDNLKKAQATIARQAKKHAAQDHYAIPSISPPRDSDLEDGEIDFNAILTQPFPPESFDELVTWSASSKITVAQFPVLEKFLSSNEAFTHMAEWATKASNFPEFKSLNDGNDPPTNLKRCLNNLMIPTPFPWNKRLAIKSISHRIHELHNKATILHAASQSN